MVLCLALRRTWICQCTFAQCLSTIQISWNKKGPLTSKHMLKTSYKRVLNLFLFKLENIFRRKKLLVVGWPWPTWNPHCHLCYKKEPTTTILPKVKQSQHKMFAWQLIWFSSSHFQPWWNFQHSWFFLLHHRYLH